MDLIEEAVMWYACASGNRFVCPQFPIKGAKPDKYPDFLAIDIIKKEAFIIEVSTAENLNNLAKKIKDNHAYFKEAIVRHFSDSLLVLNDSSIYFSLFVRLDKVKWLEKQLIEFNDISIFSLDPRTPVDTNKDESYQIMFNWKWPYDNKTKRPNNPLKKLGNLTTG